MNRDGWRLLADLSHDAGARFWWLLGAMLLGAVAETVGIVSLVPLITLAVGGGAESLGRFAVLLGPEPSLSSASILFLAAIALRLVVTLVRDHLLASIMTQFEASLGTRVASAMLAMPWQQVATLGRGGIQARLSSDVARAAAAASPSVTILVMTIFFLIQFLGAALLSNILALSAASLGFLIIAIAWPAIRRAASQGGELGLAFERKHESADRLYSGLKSAAAQGTGTDFIAHYRESLADIATLNASMEQHKAYSRSLILGLAALAALALIWIGGGPLQLDAAVLAASLLLFARMVGPLQAIQQAAQQLAALLPGYHRLQPWLGGGTPDRPEPASEWHIIEAQQLGFDLPDGRSLWNEISFTLKPGQWIGVSGPSGSGKTSLVDMLARLNGPSSGALLVDGVPLAEKSGWSSGLSYIGPAEPMWRDRLDHVIAGSLAPDPGLIDQVIRLTGLDAILPNLPEGKATIIATDKAILSAGEQQRVALARALFRNPRLLILDEALSMLDPQSARAIIKRLRNDRPGMAVVLVAHRADLLDLCDTRIELVN